MARTMASGADSDGQIHAISVLRAAFSGLGPHAPGLAPATMILTGPAVFAAEARHTIQHEVGRLSVLSMVLIGSLLLLVYRSVTLLLIGFLPVICGSLAGLTAVALGFNVVYGITLGFGITLIGEAVDYSVYLFTQAGRSGAGIEATGNDWTTFALAGHTAGNAHFRVWLRIAVALGVSKPCAAGPVYDCRPRGRGAGDALRAAGAPVHGDAGSCRARRSLTRLLAQLIAAFQRARIALWPLALLAIARTVDPP